MLMLGSGKQFKICENKGVHIYRMELMMAARFPPVFTEAGARH